MYIISGHERIHPLPVEDRGILLNLDKLYLFRTPLVENDIRVSVQRFSDSRESIDSMLAG